MTINRRTFAKIAAAGAVGGLALPYVAREGYAAAAHTLKLTFADTRKWSLDDVASHPQLVTRMNELGLQDSLASVGSPQEIEAAMKGDVKPKTTPVIVPAPPSESSKPVELVKPTPAAPSTQPTAAHKTTSLFDF